jgi:small-conductance mechanosensitive channel
LLILIPLLAVLISCGGSKQSGESAEIKAERDSLAADSASVAEIEQNVQDLNERSKKVSEEIDSLLNEI